MKAGILAVDYYLPQNKLTNEALAEEFKTWGAQEIYEKTGIKERRIVADKEFASDLAVKSAEKLFDSGSCKREEIDLLIYCTQSPDYLLPTTACILQERLRLSHTCGAFDINLGCSGYIYSLAIAKAMVLSDVAEKVLIITSDTYSKYINPKDKSTRTIFGDGASATIVLPLRNGEGIMKTVMGTDGSGFGNLIVPAGGLKLPVSTETMAEETDDLGNVRSRNNLYMNGPQIFQFTLRVIPRLISDTLKKNKLAMDDINFFIFHQANKFILDHLRKKLNISESKMVYHLEPCGNTVSSSIPIALTETAGHKLIKPGELIMLVGFGVGYSWAGSVIRWEERSNFF